jgi:chemotaxis protein MotB
MEPARVPPPSRRQPEADLLDLEPENDITPRSRSNAGLYILAVLLSGAALGLGGYAWQLWSETEKLKTDVAGLEQVKQEAQQRVAQLVQENGEQKKTSEQTAGERDELKAALAAATLKLAELQDLQAASDQRLAEFKELRKKFQRMIDSGALDITFRRGRMIVEMPAAVLFDSGSAELSTAGKETVLQVAKVLRKVPSHRFLVGGHTDNVPAVKEYKSNWELSAARALEVTDKLISQGVSPRRLVLAGYSEYDPVASNGSDNGRQKNRRIEIILEPYVEEKLVAGMLEPKPADKPAASGKTAQAGKPAAAPATKK